MVICEDGALKCIPVILLVLASPVYAQMSEPYVVKDSVTDCVNVRPDHDVTTTPIACLAAGTPVTVTDVFPYWREITFGTQTGWIAKKFIVPATSPSPVRSTDFPLDAFLEVHFVDVG